jgi:hypothetical protein
MKGTVLLHRENEWEWRFIGIWADMLDKSILNSDEENKKDFLVLFKEYDSLLQVLQENLRLRNLYNQFKSNNSVAEIKKMEDDIKHQVLALSDKLELFTYYAKEDLLMKASIFVNNHTEPLC